MNTTKKTRIIILILIISLCLLSVSFIVDCYRSATPPESVGSVRLNVETYRAGENQPTHPSVVAFETPWNGYSYWMAYSPYPYGNGEEENPCIAASNDLLYWETPGGLANPIANNEETGCDELKDPHIGYREDLNRLEIWYLGRQSVALGGDGTSLLLMRKFSEDGIHWSSMEIMAQTKYLSPSIIWNGQKYQMWSIGYDLWDTKGTVVYQESLDGTHWSEPELCSLGGMNSGLDIWHGAVSKAFDTYHFVYIDYDKQAVLYCSSEDGIHYSNPEVIVENGEYWEHLYRPTLLFDRDTITCFYGVVNQKNQWYLSASTGSQINALVGLQETDISAMIPLNDEVIDTHSAAYHLRELFHGIESYFHIELIVLIVLETALVVFITKLRANKRYFWVCVCANLLVSCGYILYRFMPASSIQWLAAWIAVLLLNLGLDAVLSCVQRATGKVYTK